MVSPPVQLPCRYKSGWVQSPVVSCWDHTAGFGQVREEPCATRCQGHAAYSTDSRRSWGSSPHGGWQLRVGGRPDLRVGFTNRFIYLCGTRQELLGAKLSYSPKFRSDCSLECAVCWGRTLVRRQDMRRRPLSFSLYISLSPSLPPSIPPSLCIQAFRFWAHSAYGACSEV